MAEPSKKGFWIYRILGIIDNFIAVFFLFGVMVNFGVMGFYPPLLLPLFIALSILVYTNLSSVFCRQVLLARKPLRTKLKDWIKVNAYVTLVYAVFQFFIMLLALFTKGIIEKLGSTFEGISISTVRGMIIFLMFCSVAYAVHVIMTLRFLKQQEGFFQDPPAS